MERDYSKKENREYRKRDTSHNNGTGREHFRRSWNSGESAPRKFTRTTDENRDRNSGYRHRETGGNEDFRRENRYIKHRENSTERREGSSYERKRNFREYPSRERKFYKREERGESNDASSYNQEYRPNPYRNENSYERKRPSFPYKKRDFNRDENKNDRPVKEELRQKHYSKKKQLIHRLKNVNEEKELRLNRYISMGGICSRRDADVLITEGRVKVNGEVVQTVGVKVKRTDRVEVDDAVVTPERKVYLVLNKPKDYVTTVEDPLERKTVMTLIEGACKERVYPVGRLDRQTSGVLLFTNDGDLAKKLTHPKYEHKKIYHVFLDKPLEMKDMELISTGVELEDGFIKADEVNYVSTDQSEIGIEIHSGRNRIVRRIFEHLGYQIVKLDRVYFAGITKKNLPRGRWRFLTPEEVKVLKFYQV